MVHIIYSAVIGIIVIIMIILNFKEQYQHIARCFHYHTTRDFSI